MNLGDLLKLVIPAIFLVIWAVNQLLGKEEVTAPPRGQPIGPRPGGLPPAPRPPASREVAMGWAPAPTSPAKPKPSTFADPEEIFVIRADNDPIARPGGTSGASRRQGRPKSPKRAADPAASKRLSAPLPTSLNSAPIEVKFGDRESSPPPAQATTTPAHPLAELIRSPGRLREALILNEILGPPRALRGPRR